MRDLGLDAGMTRTTLATAIVLGVLAVVPAPPLAVRRLLRVDIPGPLRVVG